MKVASLALPFSCVDGIEWPAIASPAGATMLATQWQLDRSQWWPAERILEHQFRQLRELVTHAIAHSPHYKAHLSRSGLTSVEQLTPETFLRWPLLPNGEVPRNEAALRASLYPREHAGAAVMRFYVHALVLRDHLWHRRDFSAKLAAVGGRPASGSADDWWGVATNAAFRTGPSVSGSGLIDAREQLEWLSAEGPAYLVTSSGNLRTLLEYSLATGKIPAGIRQVITVAGPPSSELRSGVLRAWQAQVVDVYSREQLGPIALQCPSHGHYHAQAENLYVELLQQDGTPCRPGELGRVVVTALHDFPMPMLRYELGDMAEAGEACPCGRGLPVLHRIVAGASGQ